MSSSSTSTLDPRPSTKTIAVMGATGSQGGAVVKAFYVLAEERGNKEYQVRAITRDPASEKAKAIKSMVNEVVKADGDDVESMVAAFSGCYGAFLVTDFWQDLNVQHEMQVLRNLKEAAKKAGVKHIVLSTLEGSQEFVNNSENKDTWTFPEGHEETGMYVPHMDGKHQVTKEFQDEGLPVTPFITSFYYENFINFGMGPSRQSDSDPYAITLPMAEAKLQMVAVADIGKAGCAIFQDSSLIGKTVGARSTVMTVQEIADTFSKVCGVPVTYNAVPTDVYASFGFPGARDLANMFRLFVEDAQTMNDNRKMSDEFAEKMGGVMTLEEWIMANKRAFELKSEEPPEAAAPEQARNLEKEEKKPEACCGCIIS